MAAHCKVLTLVVSDSSVSLMAVIMIVFVVVVFLEPY